MAAETFIGPITIRQETEAGDQFDGNKPTGTRTVTGRVITYPLEADCGLFDFASLLASDTIQDRLGGQIAVASMDLVVVRISIRLGGPNSWTLTEIDLDGNEAIIREQAAAAETDYYKAGEDLFLPAGHTLELKTVAGAAVQTASITVVPDQFRNQQGQ